MRKVQFEVGKYYHIYNRGVDKRDVFLDNNDYSRFLKSLLEFNRLDPIGSLVDLEERFLSESNSLRSFEAVKNIPECSKGIGFQTTVPSQRLVDIVSYCLNPNHYHLLIKQLVDDGISKYLHKVGVGYTNYFNKKNQRSGSLFQGKFKSVHIDSDEHLVWVSAYVNGNSQIHGLILDVSKYQWCSYPEYLGLTDLAICNKEVILSQYKDLEKFKKANEDCFRQMKEKKDLQRYILD